MRRILPTEPPGNPNLPADHIDNGPRMWPERIYRSHLPKKTPEESAAIRAKAWETRRKNYRGERTPMSLSKDQLDAIRDELSRGCDFGPDEVSNLVGLVDEQAATISAERLRRIHAETRQEETQAENLGLHRQLEGCRSEKDAVTTAYRATIHEKATLEAQVERLGKALAELVAKMDELEKPINSVIGLHQVRGGTWSAKDNWAKEMEAAREALKERTEGQFPEEKA